MNTTPITPNTPSGTKVVRVFPTSRAGEVATLTGQRLSGSGIRALLSHDNGTRSGQPVENWEVIL